MPLIAGAADSRFLTRHTSSNAAWPTSEIVDNSPMEPPRADSSKMGGSPDLQVFAGSSPQKASRGVAEINPAELSAMVRIGRRPTTADISKLDYGVRVI